MLKIYNVNTRFEEYLFFILKKAQFNETYAEVRLHCYKHANLKFVRIISDTFS